MINRVTRIDDRVVVSNVLVSVADKRNLELIIPRLVRLNDDIRFYSTGGTRDRLAELLGPAAERHLVSVSDYTGQPEMQGGLVKTLDFKIYLGLLSETYNSSHQYDLTRTGAVTFDMVVVNLYPFREAVAKADASCEAARAHIDIGGPSMLRAAAKNFIRVAPLCDPDDYETVLEELEAANGATTVKQRFRLARKAFRHTAAYDAAIADYLEALEVSAVTETYHWEG